MSVFHEILFPTQVSLGTRGGPQRKTQIVRMGSGREERISQWAHSYRHFEAGYGVKTLAQLSQILEFFEERRGRLYGFRFHDALDFQSCSHGQTPTALDQTIGEGNGTTASFQLIKTYGADHAPYARTIHKPVAGTVLVAVNGTTQTLNTHFTLNAATGQITFLSGHIPPANAAITAGFTFHVPVRFDTDHLDIDLSAFQAGQIPSIPLQEIVP